MFRNTFFLRSIVLHLVMYLVYFSGIAHVRAVLLRRQYPLVRVLLIHHIKNPVAFERMVQYLVTHCHVLSFEDFSGQRFDRCRINVLLTLDDGYASWYTSGLPILEKYGMPAVFFVSSGFVDCATDENSVTWFCQQHLKLNWVSQPLDRHMLSVLATHPLITVGGHTQSHPFLSLITSEYQFQEIEADKHALEAYIGKSVRAFAYPFGQYTKDTVRLAAQAGYTHVFTTQSDFYKPTDNSLCIPRSNHGTISNLHLRMWLIGAADMYEKLVRWAIK